MSATLLSLFNNLLPNHLTQPATPEPTPTGEVSTSEPISPQKAISMITAGTAPDGLSVDGALNLAGNSQLGSLPANLSATSLNLAGCTALRELPPGLKVRRLDISGCTHITRLPNGLHLSELNAGQSGLREIPSDLRVEFRLDLSNCLQLESLPRGLKTGSLVLAGCSALEHLPEELDVYFLDVSNCVSLFDWPAQASVRVGRLNASGCHQLRSLPPWLGSVSQLDISGCANLCRLPDGLHVSSALDVAGSGIVESGVEALPASLRHAPLRWRGVPVDERIVFAPETIEAGEVLSQPNAEVRRVLLECMSYEKFLRDAQAAELDRDRDPGGERRLLRVEMQDDEALVCLAVFCPSTGRQYMLRVPPATRSCHQAAAWIAGFDNADDYQPLQET